MSFVSYFCSDLPPEQFSLKTIPANNAGFSRDALQLLTNKLQSYSIADTIEKDFHLIDGSLYVPAALMSKDFSSECSINEGACRAFTVYT
jgi:hypothetical protein